MISGLLRTRHTTKFRLATQQDGARFNTEDAMAGLDSGFNSILDSNELTDRAVSSMLPTGPNSGAPRSSPVFSPRSPRARMLIDERVARVPQSHPCRRTHYRQGAGYGQGRFYKSLHSIASKKQHRHVHLSVLHSSCTFGKAPLVHTPGTQLIVNHPYRHYRDLISRAIPCAVKPRSCGRATTISRRRHRGIQRGLIVPFLWVVKRGCALGGHFATRPGRHSDRRRRR